ncbi:MAG: formylglycine-generating enzyme family protein [Anaerolineae bacterium]|nr:formylglycine-generating enzyme family protein [Anaerolineae bacterium]
MARLRLFRWLPVLIGLAALAVFAAALLLRPSAPPPPRTPAPLPTVTPPGPGEPTVPPEALRMRAAPTPTRGRPPSTPTPIPPRASPTPLPTRPVSAAGHDDVPMIEIPAGEFIMGITEGEVTYLQDQWRATCGPRCITFYQFHNEAPQMIVSLDTFWIDQYKVTNARYRRCVEAGICSPPEEDNWRYSHYDNFAARVNWYDADAYCRWVGKRLPTEAEWEKAARGTDGRWYPWGNEYDKTRHARQEGPVDQHPQGASPYGVLGALDYPSEWTSDWYRPYPGNRALYPAKDTSDPYGWNDGLYDMGYRSARGLVRDGGHAEDSRVTMRAPGHPEAHLGFRCVRGPQPVPLEQAILWNTAPTPVPTLMPARVVDLSNMVYVPAGPFIMGTNEVSPDDFYRGDETPLHIVYLDAFYIDRTEVTRREFAAFLKALGTDLRACEGYNCGSGWISEKAEYSDYPAMGVTWYGAQAYCTWVGKRLPTEAEWEKAARGTDGRRYPWGNEPTFLGNYRDPVGSRPENASPYGMLDALGNVVEWVADWYDPAYYTSSPLVNPLGPPTGTKKVVRGFGLFPVTYRDPEFPYTEHGIGFRCAYSPGR